MDVYFLNTMAIGLDTIQIVSKKTKIKGVIGLTKRNPGEAISDYVYQKEFCTENNLDFIELETYNFSSKKDIEKLKKIKIDVLVVSGWQRLVPNWLIEQCKFGVIGIHGSPLGITKGRGRSPQNWALILGLEKFSVSIFKIDPGIDSGKIIDTKTFKYSQFDNIKTSYYKVCLLTAQMISNMISSNKLTNNNFEVQDESEAEYFPQRKPEDSYIDWDLPSERIRGFIRAITNPYPGATTIIKDCEVKIWSAIPFDLEFDSKAKPGQIVKIFNKGDLLVKTSDGYLLIEDYEVKGKLKLKEEHIFISKSYEDQMKRICSSHREKYPNLPLSSLFQS